MIWIAGLAVLAAAGVIVYDRLRLRRTMNRLDRMLDDAIRGAFTPAHFDESRLSAVEAKLGHYLDASGTSAARLAEDRARMQGLIADVSHQTKTPRLKRQLSLQSSPASKATAISSPRRCLL